jgi:hypothetical protein
MFRELILQGKHHFSLAPLAAWIDYFHWLPLLLPLHRVECDDGASEPAETSTRTGDPHDQPVTPDLLRFDHE